MIEIHFPDNHIEERSYIINVLFGEFLGLVFQLTPKPDLYTTIIKLENNNLLIIEDAFFNNIDGLQENYLHQKNIPSEVFHTEIAGGPEKNIIGLYGKPEISHSDNKIVCSIDLFASAFFMLTRWEEYANKDRDICERFPEKSSLAYQHGFLSRPIVNEYVECIWEWLKQLDINQTRKVRQFEFINTHDIDSIKLFEKKHHYIAKVVKAVLIERTLSSLLHHSKLAFQSIMGKDPFLAFDYFMDTSEKYGIKSHFFFMVTRKKTKYDNGYDISSKTVKNIITNIKNRGHIIGIHPSYGTFNNSELLSSEINTLREISDTNVSCGRQHYLRFDLPTTWQHWEDNNMDWDSSLAYSQQEGFRCGVCYSFPVFNILTRKQLKLREKPLTIMDGTLVAGGNKTPEEVMEIIHYYLQKVKQYSGEFVFLWHNASFEYMFWKNYRQVYEDSLLSIVQEKQ